MILLGSFIHTSPLWLITVLLLTSIVVFYLLGSKTGKFVKEKHPAMKADGVGPLEGALLGLLSLLLAFTFSQSASRYDTRRTLIIQEANSIGTVIQYSDMYPDSMNRLLKTDLEQYVDVRISYYGVVDDHKIDKLLSEAVKISNRICKRVQFALNNQPNIVRDNQMVPAVSAMIDFISTRDASRLAKVPNLIYYLLIILTVLGSFIVGYSKKEHKNDWIILLLYSAMTTMTIFAILDLDRPTTGIIQTSVTHKKMNALRSNFYGVQKF